MTRIVVLFVFMNSAVWAQTYTITGNTLSREGAVEFAHISIPQLSMGATANGEGHFELTKVPAGRWKIHVTAVGFQKKITEVEVNQNVTISIDMQEDVSQLQEVVVTGTMREVSKMSSPIPVEVYSSALFLRNPTPNIFESLSIINGVQSQINCNVCNTGDIHINGLEGPYTMILIDGMPIVSSLSTVYGLAGIPNSLVKRMEIVKGPASTLYGSEAVGGVINIITKDPVNTPALQADVFATSVGEYNVDVSSSLKMKKATGLFGLNYFNYTNPRDINQDNFTDVTLQDRISLFNKWSIHRPSGKNFSVAARYVHENRWGGELQWQRQHRGTDIYYGESIYTNRAELLGSYELPKVAGMHLDFSFNDHRQDSYYGTVKYLARQEVAFVQLRWSKSLGKHQLLGGIPLRKTYYDDNSPATENPRMANTFLPGIFVQDELELSKQWSALGGYRFDHHSVHGAIHTPRLSLKYSPSKNTTVRLTGGSGYRVVNLFTEDHAALSGSRIVEIRNDLQPENSWNGNINIAQNLLLKNGFITLDASAFYTYFTNKIVGDFLTDANRIIYDNLNGHAISKGITLNADASFSNSLKLIGGVTLMDVFQVDEALVENRRIPQLNAPRFSGTFTGSYTLPKSKVIIDLTARVNGPMHLPVVPDDFRPAMSPWFALMNIQATKKLNHQLEVYGGVKNLLNFVPRDPLLRPFDPFDRNIGIDNPNGYTFDASYNYAPIQGAKAFAGLRWTIQ